MRKVCNVIKHRSNKLLSLREFRRGRSEPAAAAWDAAVASRVVEALTGTGATPDGGQAGAADRMVEAMASTGFLAPESFQDCSGEASEGFGRLRRGVREGSRARKKVQKVLRGSGDVPAGLGDSRSMRENACFVDPAAH